MAIDEHHRAQTFGVVDAILLRSKFIARYRQMPTISLSSLSLSLSFSVDWHSPIATTDFVRIRTIPIVTIPFGISFKLNFIDLDFSDVVFVHQLVSLSLARPVSLCAPNSDFRL